MPRVICLDFPSFVYPKGNVSEKAMCLISISARGDKLLVSFFGGRLGVEVEKRDDDDYLHYFKPRCLSYSPHAPMLQLSPLGDFGNTDLRACRSVEFML